MNTRLNLKYPKKSHRKLVVVPRNSASLAEFFGIMLGDGGINNPWQINVTLNTDADAEYILYVSDLIKKLFGAVPAIRARKTKRATIVSLASTTIVDFLVSKGLPRGNKLRSGLRIPKWILRRKGYKIACVRGLVDTDGCSVLHVHKVSGRSYKNLYLSFSSMSPELLTQVFQVLVGLGLSAHFSTSRREVWLYSAKDVKRYLQVVGSSNERIRRVYRKWRDG